MLILRGGGGGGGGGGGRARAKKKRFFWPKRDIFSALGELEKISLADLKKGRQSFRKFFLHSELHPPPLQEDPRSAPASRLVSWH